MPQNMNQFKQSAVVGEVDLQTNANPALFTCKYKDASETANKTIAPGIGLKLIDLGADDYGLDTPPIVDVMADDNDGGVFGVKIFTPKKNANVDGDIVQVAGEGAVVFMNSGAAIERGAKVALVIATPGNVVTATTEDEVGVCLDKADAEDQLVRILIKPVAVST